MWFLGGLLFILKILGIIIAVILVLLLVVIIFLLMVPMKYCLKAGFHNDLNIDAKFSWIFSLISVKYKLEGDQDDLQIKIPFGFGNNDKDENKLTSISADSVNKIDNIEADDSLDDNEDNYSDVDEDNNFEENVINGDFFIKIWYNNIKSVIRTIINRIRSLRKKIVNICSMLNDGKVTLDGYKEAIVDFNNKFGIRAVLKPTLLLIKRLYKFVKPKKCDMGILFGFDDPADTGMVLAMLAMITPTLPFCVAVDTDFESSCFECDVNLQGSTCLLFLIIPILKYIFTEPILDVIKKYWG